jgi:hypothetical protein
LLTDSSAVPQRTIDEPSPVNKVEPIPEGASFFIFAQVLTDNFSIYKGSAQRRQLLSLCPCNRASFSLETPFFSAHSGIITNPHGYIKERSYAAGSQI